MNIKVESAINRTKTNGALIVLNGIVKAALKCNSLESLKKLLPNIDTFGFIYGFGSSHCWVKQIDSDNRILFITENI